MKEFSVFVITAADWLWGCFRQHLFCGAGYASHREHGSTDGHANHHPGTGCGILRGCGKIPF